jgi:hypothetical protein
MTADVLSRNADTLRGTEHARAASFALLFCHAKRQNLKTFERRRVLHGSFFARVA